MKKNATAKALVMSVLALMLCLSMLVGTTFAWFTDSVTSGVNKIVAGNLDIELEYCNDPSAADAEWKTVEGAEDLFGEIALWEPGTTGVVYFRLSNLGTLALKYKLGMTFVDTVVGTSVLGDEIKLSEILEFGIVADQADTFASRQAAMDAVTGAKKLSEGYTDEQSMEVTDEKTYFALVVYMPTTVGNEANYRGENIPQIDLGVTLVATQDTVESDSFDNQYDKDAWLAQVMTDNEDGTYENEGQLYVKDNGSFVAVEKDETTEGLYTAEDGTQYVATAEALNAADPENGKIGVINNITETFTGTSNSTNTILISENGNAVIDFDNYTLEIQSESGKNGIKVDEGATATISNGTITMNKVYGSSYPVIKAEKGEITLDNMTVELTADSGYGVSAGSDGGKVIVKNTTVKGPNSKYSCAVFTSSKSTLEFEGATIIGGIRAETNGSIIIKSGDFTQATFYFGGSTDSEHPRIIYAGTFAVNPQTLGNGVKLASGSTVTDNGDGTWTVTAG